MSSDNPATQFRFFRKQSFWLMTVLIVVMGFALLRLRQAEAQRPEESAQVNGPNFPQIVSAQAETEDLGKARLETHARELTREDSLSYQSGNAPPTQYQNVTQPRTYQSGKKLQYLERVSQPRVVFETVEEDGSRMTQLRSAYEEAYVPRRAATAMFAPEDSSSQRIRELTEKIRAVPEDQRSPELMAEFKQLIAEQFEQRHQSQLKRLDKILAEAKATEAALQRRQDQKDEIVQRRMLELLGERDPLNWDYQPGELRPQWETYQARPSVLRPAQPSAQPLATTGYKSDGSPLPQAPAVAQAVPPLPGFREPAQVARPAPPADFSRYPSSSFSPFLARSGANESDFSDPSVGGQAFASSKLSGSAGDAKEIIATGYRLKASLSELAGTTKMVEQGLINKAALADLDNSLNETRTIWEFQKRDLKGRLEVAKIALENAKGKLESMERIPNKTNITEQQTFEVRKELSIAELELGNLTELLGWMKTFEESLSKEEMQSAKVDNRNQFQEDTGSDDDTSEDASASEQIQDLQGR